jgi:hypothetical protein
MNGTMSEILELYQNTLSSQGFVAREERDHNAMTSDRKLSHARWMIDRIQTEGKTWTNEKQLAYFGFIQGALWAEFQFTRPALEDHLDRISAAYVIG